ncbi:8581_t:CDS:1, partial [Racocetra persica]
EFIIVVCYVTNKSILNHYQRRVQSCFETLHSIVRPRLKPSKRVPIKQSLEVFNSPISKCLSVSSWGS